MDVFEQDDDKNVAYTAKVGENHIVYGLIYINGCTTENACCANVVNAGYKYIKGTPKEINYGSKAWHSYTQSGKANPKFDYNNVNDEYMVDLNFELEGVYSYVYTFDLKKDPSDVNEMAQTVHCYANWKHPVLATGADLGVATIK